jgi:hypothetical protein
MHLLTASKLSISSIRLSSFGEAGSKSEESFDKSSDPPFAGSSRG